MLFWKNTLTDKMKYEGRTYFQIHDIYHMWCLLCDKYLNCEPDFQSDRIHFGIDHLESMWNLSVFSGMPQRCCHLVLEKTWAGRILRAGSKTYHALQDCLSTTGMQAFCFPIYASSGTTQFLNNNRLVYHEGGW